jgi:hypothetical protein
MNGTVRRSLARSALCALIILTVVPAATAQWLPPFAAVSPREVEQMLQAQGYLLIAPLHRRPRIYLADVSAGPRGYQRLVIDAWSGDILQRFVAPARRWGPQLAERGGEFALPRAPGFIEPGLGGGFSMPDGGPAANSPYGGPPDVRIPAAISPFGSPGAPPATKPKPKSNATRNNPGAASPAAVPLPPPKPTENQDSDKPKTDSPPTEVESAPPAALEGANEDASKAGPAAPPDLKPEAAPTTEPSSTAQSEASATQPSATTRSEGPATQPATHDSSAQPSEKSKVSIVPAALFE